MIDEAWSLMQYPEGGAFLASMARRARKYYLGLVTITQDVADFLECEHGRTVLPMPISEAPYYGLTSVAASLLSRDGLRVDDDLAVLDRKGVPIAGLYAVGEVLGNNVFAGDNYVGGMSVTPAMTLGRELGRALAARRGSAHG